MRVRCKSARDALDDEASASMCSLSDAPCHAQALAVDIAMVKFRGLAEAATRTNFDVSGFADELGSLDGVSNDELVLFLRRQSKCFAASPAAAAAEAARAASADADASGDARAAAVDASAGSETLAGGSNSKGLYAYRGVHRLSSGKFEVSTSCRSYCA